MDIIRSLFKWFTVKGNSGEEMNLGYVLDGEPKTFEDIEKLLKAYKLEQYANKLKPLVREKIDLELFSASDSDFLKAESKIGGQPDLLSPNDWPKTEEGKSMMFIAQFNGNEVAKFDKTGLFPKDGLISFFYCADQAAWGFDPKDISRFKVLYHSDIENLEKIVFPVDLDEYSILKPNKIKFNSCLSLPGWEEDCINGIIQAKDSDNYFELCGGSENQIFGYANSIQGPMELECELVTNGFDCGSQQGYKNSKRQDIQDGKKDWVLLFQIGSEEEKTGMMWGDVGRIYFWIKRKDLLEKRFDRCWFVYQCH